MYKSDERSEKSEQLIAKKKTNGKARTQYVKSVETRVSKENSQEKLENQTTDHFFLLLGRKEKILQFRLTFERNVMEGENLIVK